MTGPAKEGPRYLLAVGRSVQIEVTWAAVGLPSDWGHIVLDALGDQAGAVFEYRAMTRLVWVLPPGGAADWPLARNNAVYRFGLIDPTLLRRAVETVLGPLEEAGRCRRSMCAGSVQRPAGTVAYCRCRKGWPPRGGPATRAWSRPTCGPSEA